MTKEEILAMEAGQELDTLIAQTLNFRKGRVNVRGYTAWFDSDDKIIGFVKDWHPSTEVPAAWPVVDKMFELGYAMSLLHLSSEFYPEYWYCDFRPKDSNKPPEYEWVDHQMAAPVAICKAALLTRLDEIKKLEEGK